MNQMATLPFLLESTVLGTGLLESDQNMIDMTGVPFLGFIASSRLGFKGWLEHRLVPYWSMRWLLQITSLKYILIGPRTQLGYVCLGNLCTARVLAL